ncbi:addiction module antitoxin [Thiomicrospira aerophila AL3]|uniref:Addiction module antitoxin n=1 Tax=Thiomicrospira aerophila AL3 TaxID=717772 RepID=W0DSY5_9GAMM|nr:MULTISPECIES: addiction module antidote protein [Thiomicrospira]AHF01700.1 addiction module antitoxin [Thiomicrospira aerophila AL3]UQB41905.1 putative addiction module antidote protein [Thiomicrospira microaerophila]
MTQSMNDTFNVSDYLNTPEDVKAYLQAALDENDPAFFIDALGVVARSSGMKALSEKTGLGYQSLYKSFGEGKHPRFETVFKVIEAMGLRFKLAS